MKKKKKESQYDTNTGKEGVDWARLGVPFYWNTAQPLVGFVWLRISGCSFEMKLLIT